MAPCKLYFYILFNIFENTKTLTLYPLRCAKAAFSGFFLPENDQRVAFYCFLREIRHNCSGEGIPLPFLVFNNENMGFYSL